MAPPVPPIPRDGVGTSLTNRCSSFWSESVYGFGLPAYLQRVASSMCRSHDKLHQRYGQLPRKFDPKDEHGKTLMNISLLRSFDSRF